MKTEEQNIEKQEGNVVLPCVSGSFTKQDLKKAYMAGYSKHAEAYGMNITHEENTMNDYQATIWVKNYR